MESLGIVAIVLVTLIVLALVLSIKIVKQYEIGVDKNTTVVFPAPLMTTIAELGSFLAREKAASEIVPPAPPSTPVPAPASPNGSPRSEVTVVDA